MKKLLATMLALLMALTLLPTAVFADVTLTGKGTEVEPYLVDSDESLRAAFAAGGVIKLYENIYLTKPIDIENSKSVTLYLNTYSITPDASFEANKLGPNDSNTFDYMLGVKRGTHLTINGEGTVSTGTNNSKIYSAIKLTLSGETASGSLAELTINGGTIEGYYYAITGNGSRHNTKITINGGTIEGIKSDDNLAIHHPQSGTLTINGGTLKGNTTLGMKSGKLTITGGTFMATGEKKNYAHNSNGFNMTGDALVVEACEYPGGLPVVVDISGGTFTSANGGAVAYYQQVVDNTTYEIENTNFISGGTFSSDVSSFAATSTPVAKVVSDNTTTYVVGSTAIAAAANAGKDVTVIKSGAITGVNTNATIKVGKEVTGSTTVNGEAVAAGSSIVFYTVTFNDGSTTTTETVKGGEAVAEPADPTKTGYTFDYWCIESGDGHEQYVFTTPVNGNITLTAHWTINTYTVTYSAGKNGSGTVAAGTKTYGEDMTLNSTGFTRSGYTQIGWATTDGGEKVYDMGGKYTADEAVTLYPVWQRNAHGIYRPQGGSSATTTPAVNSPKTADAGIAIYGVMAISSVLGMGYIGKKKF